MTKVKSRRARDTAGGCTHSRYELIHCTPQKIRRNFPKLQINIIPLKPRRQCSFKFSWISPSEHSPSPHQPFQPSVQSVFALELALCRLKCLHLIRSTDYELVELPLEIFLFREIGDEITFARSEREANYQGQPFVFALAISKTYRRRIPLNSQHKSGTL